MWLGILDRIENVARNSGKKLECGKIFWIEARVWLDILDKS